MFDKGYYRIKIDGERYKFRSHDDIKNLNLQKTHKHSIDVIVDSLEIICGVNKHCISADLVR